MYYFLFILSCTVSTQQNKPPKQEITPSKHLSHHISNVEVQEAKTIPIAKGYFAADLDGDGIDEQIYYDETGIRTPKGLLPLQGNVQVAKRGDRDQDGKQELIIGLGSGKGFRDAPMELLSLQEQGLITLWKSSMGNNQIPDLHVFKDSIFFVHSTENTEFAGSFLEKTNEVRTIATSKLALRMIPKDEHSVYVGRVYGEEPRSDGDLRLFRNGEPQQAINSFRGIRALSLSDVNQDGIPELLVSDGWHFQYGTMARARLSLFTSDDANPIPLSDIPSEYTINTIEPHKDISHLFLLEASRGAYILYQTEFGWKTTKVCTFAEGDNAVFWYSQDQTSVLCSGRKASQYKIVIQH